mmetsp:Transcript_13240/g.33043  ORF Transcript_13240/g.33043 Transcript_13240/m.33043 type:complete len:187 (+) Transcript_13240:3-563(+)
MATGVLGEIAGVFVECVPRRCCVVLTAAGLYLPPLMLHGYGFLMVMRLLADASNTKIGEVFALWRLPGWEEAAVVAAVGAAWIGLFLLAGVLTACLRLVQGTGWPLFAGLYAGMCMMMELILGMVVYSHGEMFLPRILQFLCGITTPVLVVCNVGFVTVKACGILSKDGSEYRPQNVGSSFSHLFG